MLNIETLRTAARAKFKALVTDRVTYIARDCWDINVKSKLEAIKDIIEAARKMGATETRLLTDEMVTELEGDLRILITLEMKAEAYAHLRGAMQVLGIEFLPSELPPKK